MSHTSTRRWYQQLPVAARSVLLAALVASACTPRVGPPDCSLGLFWGGDAGTDRCAPDHSFQSRLLPIQELKPWHDAWEKLEHQEHHGPHGKH